MLKKVLSLLLSKFYSKQENELVGHQGFPATNFTTLLTNKSIDGWGTVAEGVAPYDGYLRLRSNPTGDATASLALITPALQSVILYPFGTAANIENWAPIAKGESWIITGSRSTNISLKLYKTIGGGIKLLRDLFCKEVCYVA